MDYLSIFLAGVVLGLFASVMVLVVILAHPARPGWRSHGYQPFPSSDPTPPPPAPKVAQMPVHEAGIVAYQFLGVTGEEQA